MARLNRLPVNDQPCLEEHLAEIATSIIKWREISPFLCLTQVEEYEIIEAVPPLSVLEQKIAMLRRWKKKKGIAATYNQVLAFRKSEQLDLEDNDDSRYCRKSYFSGI